MRSEKTQGQDLIRKIGMKSIVEDLGGIRDKSLVISDGVTGGKLWSGGGALSVAGWKRPGFEVTGAWR